MPEQSTRRRRFTGTRRRVAAAVLALTVFGGVGVALAPAASANAVYITGRGSCWFGPIQDNAWVPFKFQWERSSSGASRHAYTVGYGDVIGTGNSEAIYAVNFWQSYDPFGPAVNGSYIVYPSGTAVYSYITPPQPSSRMPYVANDVRLRLNLELTRWNDNLKCRRSAKITATGYVWDA